MGNESKNEGMSLSKQRKLARQEEIAKQKRQAATFKVVVVILVLALIALVVWAVVSKIQKVNNEVEINTNFSEQLDDNGRIKGVNAADYLTMPDYNNITVDRSELLYSDEKVDADIKNIVSGKSTIDKSEDLVAKNGDKVNIDYVGYMDGVAFDGGSATAYDLVLGSNLFIDDYEAQIEGHKPGEKFDVNVTFPDPYENNPAFAGKDAKFEVTLNGIYVAPEFTDDFVKENLSEYASTVEEYRQYLKDTNYKKNLSTYVQDYVVKNTTLNSKPKDYLKQIRGNFKAQEYSYFEYMNMISQQYQGTAQYASFEDYLSKQYNITEEQFDIDTEANVSDSLKFMLFCQAVADKENINVTLNDAKEYYLKNGTTEEAFTQRVETYGTGYVVQQYLDTKVIDLLLTRVNVNG
ncbi:MAG: FKBP-type peptidyl-prolyl cis-trans isomerase [Lachnospiraceae bacterium]|nr:FKBP-type peptidyl-prolyl cis-trans isomerase [Lachnospiraceae bacterium]